MTSISTLNSIFYTNLSEANLKFHINIYIIKEKGGE